MKKLVTLFIVLFGFINLFGQTTKEELRECTSQKFYINDFKGSIECLSKLIALNPKDSVAYNDRGLIKEILKDYTGAIADYSTQININSTFADSYFFRAMAKGKIKDRKGAIDDYTKTIKYEPNNSDAYYFRGLNKFALKNNSAAAQDFEKALKKRVDNYPVYADLGLLKAQNKNYALAIKYCNKTISLDKKCDKAYYYLGWIYAQQKNYLAAIQSFEKVLNYNPTTEEDLFYGNLKQKYKGFSLALLQYNNEEVTPKTDSAYYKKGVLNYYLKDYKSAIQNLDIALELNPKLAIARYKRAMAKGKLNQSQESIAEFTKYLSLVSNNDKAYYFIALEYEKLKDFESAILNLNKAIEVNEYLPQYYLKRGKLLMKTYRFTKGCEDIQKSKQLGGIYYLNYTKINCK